MVILSLNSMKIVLDFRVLKMQSVESSALFHKGTFFFKTWYTFVNLFIYLYFKFLAALGLCCCARAFSSCGERGLLFVVVRGLLTVVASLVEEHGL